jgi:hypothetical protein
MDSKRAGTEVQAASFAANAADSAVSELPSRPESFEPVEECQESRIHPESRVVVQFENPS